MAEYIEIDSTFRDRNRFPNPAQFEILLSDSALKLKQHAVDPVCLSTPLKVFSNSMTETGATGAVSGIVQNTDGVSLDYGSSGDLETVIADFTDHKLTDNYYCGLNLVKENAGIFTKRRIKDYRVVGTNKVKITVDKPFDNLVQGDTLTISNPSDFGIPIVFVPNSGNIDNQYIDHYLYNETKQLYTKIVHYDGKTHMVHLNSDISAWDDFDVLCIRKELPMKTEAITPTTFTQNTLTDANLKKKYAGDFIRIINTDNPQTKSVEELQKFENLRITNMKILKRHLSQD